MKQRYNVKPYRSVLTVVVAVAVAFGFAGPHLDSCIVKSKDDHISSMSVVQRSSITLHYRQKLMSKCAHLTNAIFDVDKRHTYLPPRPSLRRAKPIHLGTGLLMLVSANLYFLSAMPPSFLSHQGQFPNPPDTGCKKKKLCTCNLVKENFHSKKMYTSLENLNSRVNGRFSDCKTFTLRKEKLRPIFALFQRSAYSHYHLWRKILEAKRVYIILLNLLQIENDAKSVHAS